ncbi:glycoside hydrolase family 81 protein [Lentithecium fluviatile CBS 122367]|uniref:glucan endo-1,3-beta-D-glucosidase n=1 Tax=Lentithecium fluviatile CBS 122367 TaxID=1168545 RepID=A0A6G1JBU8_9PLEO|nr:glycoside hydrolase family 81 protein [Lentithecium fluviatile CBS 122367]
MMARLAFFLGLTQIALIQGLPAGELRRDAFDERAITLTSELPVTTIYSSPLTTLQSATESVEPSLTGIINTALPSKGFSQDPLMTSDIPEPTGTLAPIDSTLDPGPTSPLSNADANIFVPMATDAPPQQVTSRGDHVVKKINIVDKDIPIETNKFYANLFLGNQTEPVWTHPYSLLWAKGRGDTHGIAISHIERDNLTWGGDQSSGVPRYFIAPIDQQHVVLSAAELGGDTVLSTEDLTAFSVYANLAPSADSDPIISFPLVQGMGFVTGLYRKAKPQLRSGVHFRTLQYVEQLNGITYKYQLQLENDSHWLIYVTPVGSLGAPPFTLLNSSLIEGPESFVGMIQVAKNPAGDPGEKIYDSTVGVYAVNATISGTANAGVGSYTIEWGKDGVQNQTLLMFALPHHVESLDQQMTSDVLTNIELVTTTKGYARAIIADKMTMLEQNLPDTIGFAPWIPNSDGTNGGKSSTIISEAALALVRSSGTEELAQDIDKQTRLNSMYYSGKGLAKFAGIIYTMQTIANNTELAAAGLVKLKSAIDVFVQNTQPLPLVYDTVWKGVVSSGTYNNGDTGLDFGNTLYNDHHFHYGYFVYTAAIIGLLDPAWLEQGSNKAWVNMLVRDFANPSISDPYFPFQRSFDWFHGHSWAKGLFASGDGKDQESTSEDTFATYALKMWGRTSGDANMEARANLQLAVQARSLRNYFLLASDNKVQPERFLPNKVTGVLFENKVDHVTYFGDAPELVQGIHMIPINPSSPYTRPKKFVQEEWDTYFAQGRVDLVQGGWRGILYSNLVLIDPQKAFDFFASPTFDAGLLDGGASRTWYLAYTAALAAGTQPGVGVEDNVLEVQGTDAGETEVSPEETVVQQSNAEEDEEDSVPEETEVPEDEVYTEGEGSQETDTEETGGTHSRHGARRRRGPGHLTS